MASFRLFFVSLLLQRISILRGNDSCTKWQIERMNVRDDCCRWSIGIIAFFNTPFQLLRAVFCLFFWFLLSFLRIFAQARRAHVYVYVYHIICSHYSFPLFEPHLLPPVLPHYLTLYLAVPVFDVELDSALIVTAHRLCSGELRTLKDDDNEAKRSSQTIDHHKLRIFYAICRDENGKCIFFYTLHCLGATDMP